MCSTAFHSQAFKVGHHSSNLDGGDVCGREHYGHEITGMLQKKDAECRRNTQFSFASSLCWKCFFFFFLSSVLCHRSHVGPFAALYHWVGSCNPVNECSNDCLNHVLSLILNLFFSKKGTIQKLLL